MESKRGSLFTRDAPKQDFYDYDDEGQLLTAQEFESKVVEWQRAWAAQRHSVEMSVARWRSDVHLAEVTHTRGNQLSKVGFMSRSRRYMMVEEVMYLVDRGSLLLVRDEVQGRDQPMSRQECYQLMVAEGVTVALFQAYCRLRRHGFVVKRSPSVWTYADSLRSVHEHWTHAWPDSRRIVEAHACEDQVAFDCTGADMLKNSSQPAPTAADDAPDVAASDARSPILPSGAARGPQSDTERTQKTSSRLRPFRTLGNAPLEAHRVEYPVVYEVWKGLEARGRCLSGESSRPAAKIAISVDQERDVMPGCLDCLTGLNGSPGGPVKGAVFMYVMSGDATYLTLKPMDIRDLRKSKTK